MDTQNKISEGFEEWFKETEGELKVFYPQIATDSLLKQIMKDAYVSGALHISKVIAKRMI